MSSDSGRPLATKAEFQIMIDFVWKNRQKFKIYSQVNIKNLNISVF